MTPSNFAHKATHNITCVYIGAAVVNYFMETDYGSVYGIFKVHFPQLLIPSDVIIVQELCLIIEESEIKGKMAEQQR